MKNGYKITRDKFLSPKELRLLLRLCEERAYIDLHKGRKTWVTRYMVIHLALSSGLRVSEIASLKIGDLFINGKGDTYLIVQNGKGGRKRDVYLDRDIVKHIKQYNLFSVIT